MNVVMIIPTGIGCEIGGHAGDATPEARILATASENLIIHPNVVNASDIAELTYNMWYVEGSCLDKFLEGHYSLTPSYSNKLLLAVNKPISIDTVNSVNAARYTLGVEIDVLKLDNLLTLKSEFAEAGNASGSMTGHLEALVQIRGRIAETGAEALAIQSFIEMDQSIKDEYLERGGVNPWGGIEAICSRFFSKHLGIQCAHSPFEDCNGKVYKPKRTSPRLGAEMASISFLHCILKGLHGAPKLTAYDTKRRDALRVDDIDLLVSPHGCWGAPHESCSRRGIPIVFVSNNKTIYDETPTGKGIHYVRNYREAAGLICSLRAGVAI